MGTRDDTDLREIGAKTIEHYDHNAEGFWLATKDHDVGQNIDALIRHIQTDPPHSILDLGCAAGRDLAALRRLGHEAIGLEGSGRLCDMARRHSGCQVLHQNFLSLELPNRRFHGIFANASLFHVPTRALPRVLSELYASLIPNGVLLSSNPHGADEEGWQRDRYGAFHSPERWIEFVGAAGFTLLEHYYRPRGLPREQQPWLVTVWRKIDYTGT